MEPLMDVLKNSEEPEWLEKKVSGEIRIWHILFLCLAAITTMVIMVCCCFRFRIPRTKQQIEADYQRRKITTKFRQQLETIQDAKMDAMSLKDDNVHIYLHVINTRTPQALDLLHEKTNYKNQTMEGDNQQGSQASSVLSPQQSEFFQGSLDAPSQPEGQNPEPQVSGLSFVKFASKVATLSKLGQPKSPTSPTPSGNKLDF